MPLDFEAIRKVMKTTDAKDKVNKPSGVKKTQQVSQPLYEDVSRQQIIDESINYDTPMNYSDEDLYGSLPDFGSQNNQTSYQPNINEGISYNPNIDAVPTVNENIMKNSKLPPGVLESFRDKPPMRGNSSEVAEEGVLSESEFNKMFGQQQRRPTQQTQQQPRSQQPKQQIINETITPTQSQQMVGGIDYSLIKMIIENAVETKLKELIGDLAIIKIGKEFGVIDAKGKQYIYEVKGKVNE